MIPTPSFLRSGNLSRYREGIDGMLDRWYKTHIAFHHVPKCGGTSISRPFKIKFLLSQVKVDQDNAYYTTEFSDGLKDPYDLNRHAEYFRRELFIYNMISGKHFVQGHVYFWKQLYDRFHDTYKFITIIREPVARYVSHYYFDLNKPTFMNISDPLDTFVESDRGRRAGSIYVRYFGDWIGPGRTSITDALRRAKENLLLFSAVGRLENMKSFEDQLAANTGLKLAFGHANKGETKEKEFKGIDEAMRRRIETVCEPDLELFHYVSERFG